MDALIQVLTAYARQFGGRFLLFGSAARKQITFASDIDLLLDFPTERMNEAWVFAEQACAARDLEADILPWA